MRILKYTSGLLLLLILLSSSLKAQEHADSAMIPGTRLRGFRIGYDLASLALLYFEPQRMIYTVSVDYEAWQDIYPVIEAGYQSVRIEEDKYRYESGGFFARAGLDVNLMQYERPDVYDMIYGGLRYGISNFNHRADDIFIQEDYFGDFVNGSIPESRITAHWISLAGGIRVELFNNFFIGWSVLANLKLAVGDAGNMAPYNIPGFGPGDKKASLVIKYSIEYRIPTQRYHPRKIVKRRSES
jgi:hypothetical protein